VNPVPTTLVGTAFSRPSTVPARSDTGLVSSTTYNARGEANQTADPTGTLGTVADLTFDDAGRLTEKIEDQQFVWGCGTWTIWSSETKGAGGSTCWNPPVQFVVRNVALKWPPQRIGRDKQHVKLWITDSAVVHEVVWWNCAGEPLPSGRFDLACAPQLNEYNGRESVQLKLLAWRGA